MVWPDPSPDWRDVDEYPDNVVRQRAWKVYERASKLDVVAALALGASKGRYDHVPFFRFDEEAHGIFLDWRTDLERRLRSGEESPALEGHLAKYRKLVPTLALLNHIGDTSKRARFHRNQFFERWRSQSISKAMQGGYTGPARRVNSRQRKQF